MLHTEDPLPHSPSHEEPEMGTPPLYFDILPESALANVVRSFSRSPRAQNWPNYTFLDDVYHMYDVDGDLKKFMLARFSGVLVNCCERLSVSEMDLDHLQLADEDMIACTRDYILRLSTSALVVPSFETIVVGDLSGEGTIRNSNFDSLTIQWPNVRCLFFARRCIYMKRWLDAFGGNLHALCFHPDASNPMIDLSQYSANLRHLYLGYIYTGFNLDWQRVGKYLETVSAYGIFDVEGITSNITKYCPNIKRLELPGHELVPKCVAFYGDQLENVGIANWSDRIVYWSEIDMKLVKSA